MAVQLHTYLSPSDDPGEEVLDRAVFILTTLNIQRQADKLLAYPRGHVYKSRAKYRGGRGPEETDVDPIRRFCSAADAPYEPHEPIELTLGNNVPDPIRQIEAALLAMLLQDTAQAGSIVVND